MNDSIALYANSKVLDYFEAFALCNNYKGEAVMSVTSAKQLNIKIVDL